MIRKQMVCLFGMMLVFGGCVSKKEYLRTQRDCRDEKHALTERMDILSREKDALAQAAEAKEAELAQLRGTYDQLVGDLKNEISSGQIQVTQLKGKLTLNMVEKILFNSGQANVKESGQQILNRIAAALKSIRDKDIRVEGYTDNIPLSPKLRDRFPTNWELSTARATNVVRYLQESTGLDPSRLIAAGFGEFHPISANDTEEGRAQNRRIDIVLVPHEVSGNAAFTHTLPSGSPAPQAVDVTTPTGVAPTAEPAAGQ